MLDPEQAEARQDEIVARAREQVEKSGGTWQSHDAWGRRRLAYPIAKKEDGVYHLLVFDADGPTLDEVSRVLKIDDAVLRHMATRHIAGSRTSAPRDEGSAPAPAAAGSGRRSSCGRGSGRRSPKRTFPPRPSRSTLRRRRSREAPGAAGSDAGEADVAGAGRGSR